MAGKRAKLHLPLRVTPHGSHYRLDHPSSPPSPPWKNCLPRIRSLVPKRLGTDAKSRHVGSSARRWLIITLKECGPKSSDFSREAEHLYLSTKSDILMSVHLKRKRDQNTVRTEHPGLPWEASAFSLCPRPLPEFLLAKGVKVVPESASPAHAFLSSVLT